MLPTLVVFGPLCLLEYLIWLTPLKRTVDRLSLRGVGYYAFPLHYWIRIVLTLGLLSVVQVPIRAPFAGPASWASSFLFGMVVCMVSLAVFKLSPSRLFRAVRSRHSIQFRIHSAYILFYPSLIEELLFRWLLVVMLRPSIGWWVLILAPIINTVWHLPVWVRSFTHAGTIPWNQVAAVSVQALILAVVLTAIYVATQNLVGVVIAHAFGDWVSIAVQYEGTQGSRRK